MALRDWLFTSEGVATFMVATSATPNLDSGKAVARSRDLKTGELVPRRLAMVEPVPGDGFRARLGSFRSRTNPQAIHVVDILMARL